MHESSNQPDSLEPEVALEPRGIEATERDYEAEAEWFMEFIFERAREQAQTTYDSEEAATAAYTALQLEVNENLQKIGRLNNIVFRSSGPGVKVPSLMIQDVEVEGKQRAIALAVESAELTPLDLFDSREGHFHSILMRTERSEQSGTFSLKTLLIMSATRPNIVSMDIKGLPMSAADMYIIPNYIVECGDDSLIEIPALIEKRASQELAQELAIKGLAMGIFGRKLSELRQAFSLEDKTGLIEFTGVPVFHELARISAERARQNANQADLMSRAVLDAIGKNRRLEVSGRPLGHEDDLMDIITTGTVVDVLLPDTDSDDIDPMLVLETARPDQKQTSIYRYPFERISSMRF